MQTNQSNGSNNVFSLAFHKMALQMSGKAPQKSVCFQMFNNNVVPFTRYQQNGDALGLE